jgi:hypothetical protein
LRTLAIEINDAGLVVADEGGVLAVEPGYALAENGKVTTGAEAHGQARLKPRQVSNRFWANLSLEPGSAGIGNLNAAELAFRQLHGLWQRFRDAASGVVLVVPGGYTREQLGLLLGLAEECGIEVSALVDAAVAAATRPYPGRELVHVDAGLHRVSVTAVDQTDEAVAGRQQSLDSTGLVTVNDVIARWIAESFIYATRFDPFHDARSEQALYDRLPQWLGELREAEQLELVLPHAGEEFGVTVERDRLVSVVGGFNRAVVQLIAQSRTADGGLVVQLSERLADLPGLGRELARLDDARVVRLPTGHAAREALRGIARVEHSSGSVRLLKHLPWREDPEGDAEAAVEAAPRQVESPLRIDDPAPTHVVYRGIAYPIGGSGLAIGRVPVDGQRTIVVDGAHGGLSRLHCEVVLRDGEMRLKDLSRYGTFVNEKRVAGETVLHAADVIRIGSPGAELDVIRVAGDGA